MSHSTCLENNSHSLVSCSSEYNRSLSSPQQILTTVSFLTFFTESGTISRRSSCEEVGNARVKALEEEFPILVSRMNVQTRTYKLTFMVKNTITKSGLAFGGGRGGWEKHLSKQIWTLQLQIVRAKVAYVFHFISHSGVWLAGMTGAAIFILQIEESDRLTRVSTPQE